MGTSSHGRPRKRSTGLWDLEVGLGTLITGMPPVLTVAAYYSVLFSQLPQKERSPFMTMLWQQDPSHNEWDFMCAVYSAIRTFLEAEKITLQIWIQHTVSHLGIIARHDYMANLGWHLVQLDSGTHTLQRTVGIPAIRRQLQPINGLGLFKKALESGLPVANPQLIIAKLSDPSYDLICMNSQPDFSSQSSDMEGGFRRFVKDHPELAMSALFQVPSDRSLGTTVYQVDDGSLHPHLDLSHTAHYQGGHEDTGVFTDEGSQMDAMLGTILNNDDAGNFGDGSDLFLDMETAMKDFNTGAPLMQGGETSFYRHY